MRRLRLPIVALFVVLLAGCAAWQELSPEDKAANIGLKLERYYALTHQKVLDTYNIASESEKAFVRQEVNPKMNAAKKLIITYLESVQVWKLVGSEDPPVDLIELELKINAILEEVTIMIIQMVD